MYASHRRLLQALRLDAVTAPQKTLLFEGKGVAAGKGSSPGRVVVLGSSSSSRKEALGLADAVANPAYVLFCNDISKEDMPAVQKAAAIVALTGGLTCDAAVVARALGKPCVVSCSALSIRDARLFANGAEILATSCVVDGDTGRFVLYGG